MPAPFRRMYYKSELKSSLVVPDAPTCKGVISCVSVSLIIVF